jgi:hypothetical protein
MTALPDVLRDDPQVAVTILTTEHYNLQTARAATISETGGRASIFLGSVSAGLVALAFAGQASRTALYTFGLVLFPVLCFLGLVTFERVLQTSIDDTNFLVRINRIRRFYLEAAPQLAPYLARPAATDDKSDVLRTEGYRPGRWQMMVSIVGAIGVIDSVLFGVTAGLAAAALSDSDLWVATPVGLVTFAIALFLHQRHQQLRRAQAQAFDMGDQAGDRM